MQLTQSSMVLLAPVAYFPPLSLQLEFLERGVPLKFEIKEAKEALRYQLPEVSSGYESTLRDVNLHRRFNLMSLLVELP